jgi:hypothetical protein
MEPPNRTRTTALSDDELMIFDAIFDCFQDATNLTSFAYPYQLNLPYTHSLNDNELASFLAAALAAGLVWRKTNIHSGKQFEYFSLSSEGGALWEQERLPNWDRYITTSQRELGLFPTGSQRICGVNESVCRQFAGALFGAGLVTPTGPIRTRNAYNVRLVPWRNFERVCFLRFPTKDSVHDSLRYTDWNAYNSSRGGWRSLPEIQHYPQTPDNETMHTKPSNDRL